MYHIFEARVALENAKTLLHCLVYITKVEYEKVVFMGKFICDYCGKTFERVGNKRYKYCFCCKQCEAEFRKGKLTHPKKLNEIIIKDKYAIIKIQNNRLGELDCLIDIEDVEKIENFYWNIRYDKRHPNCTVYVESREQNKRVHLHRLITNCPKGMVVDHINSNGLDNRKNDLRVVTQRQNCLNRSKKFKKGISYCKKWNYWSVYVASKTVGRFRTSQEAQEYRKYIDELIFKGDWETLNALECVCLSSRKKVHRDKSLGLNQ